MNQENRDIAARKNAETGAERNLPGGRYARMEWVRKNNRRLRLLRYAIIGGGCIVILLGLLLLILPVFKIHRIDMEGDPGITREQDILDAVASAGVRTGGELIGINWSRVSDAVEKECPNVKVAFSVTPGKVTVRVKQRSVGYLELSGRYFTFDRDFKILSDSENEADFNGLPKVKLPKIKGFNIGEEINFDNKDADFRYILTMLDLFDQIGLTGRVNQLDVSNKFNVSYVYDGNKKIVLGEVSELSEKIASANQILREKEGSPEYAYVVVDVSDLNQPTPRPAESLEQLMGD